MTDVNAQTRTVFVIMPFSSTPTRAAEDLTEFYYTNLKGSVETTQELKYRYVVRRSDETFNINEQIIRDLYDADVVICDLSGPNANPNVMYELGVRLALSNKPVILIREESPQNVKIFDIAGFHTFEYRATQYRKVEEYVIGKLRRFEEGEEAFASPVLSILKTQPRIIEEIRHRRAVRLAQSFSYGMRGLAVNLAAALAWFLRERVSKELSRAIGFEVPNTAWLLAEHSEELKEIDFREFHFDPRVFPAYEAFVTEFPLEGALSPELEETIYGWLGEYYNQFLMTNLSFRFTNLALVSHFALETRLLWDLSLRVVSLLRADHPAEDIVSQVRKLVASSQIAPHDGRVEYYTSVVDESARVPEPE